ncbi:MAG: aldo/keto reductase [Lentisphaeria bacterium]|nr:aldo/keto reductase [Lentisphaeria bacterium]
MYTASSQRYQQISYRRCGKSGIRLPLISLGLWHNFGSIDDFANAEKMAHTAFDLGITHFDLANNYGPEPGSAERTLSQILKNGLGKYRDELIISSKAGYLMWPGPYGEWGSRKNLIASCDQSLKRLGLDYIDVFYHHRPDPETPLEESMTALADIVRSGKALYAGISNYPVDRARQAFSMLRELKVPCLLHQINVSMLNRHYEEEGMFDLLDSEGVGGILFSPLAQGLLSDKYLQGIPADSRAKRNYFLKESRITPELLEKITRLNQIASERSQTLAQMAIAWVLRFKGVTSALIGASRPEQIIELVKGTENSSFSPGELAAIDQILHA